MMPFDQRPRVRERVLVPLETVDDRQRLEGRRIEATGVAFASFERHALADRVQGGDLVVVVCPFVRRLSRKLVHRAEIGDEPAAGRVGADLGSTR